MSPSETMPHLHKSDSLLKALSTSEYAVGLSHDFYRYPARFSPAFAREIIKTFTSPGDLVLDPFSGGATTAVEARANGRSCVGTDISSLAVFLGKVKTTLYTDDHIRTIREWADCSCEYLVIGKHLDVPVGDYERNMTSRETWAIRAVIASGLESIEMLSSNEEKQLARCIWLRTGQWALDSRKVLPGVNQLRERFRVYVDELSAGALAFRTAAYAAASNPQLHCTFKETPASECHLLKNSLLKRAPKLVVTSPPYPGVHVLYHRWQIKGRRETPAPFWISGTKDGHGAAHYTLGGRSQSGEDTYFAQINSSFQSIAAVCDETTVVVQMLAFSDGVTQLPRYLNAMNDAGFEEFHTAPETLHKRLWRDVPRRKWQAVMQNDSGSSREVMLIHKLKP